MGKKIIAMLIALLSVFSLSAESDWHVIVQDVDQHTEILAGFLPTYLYGGVGYRGARIFDEHTTDIQLMFGAGYIQRKLWQDPVTGESTEAMWEKPITYDVFVLDWALRFKQGFLHSPWDPEADLLTLTLAYEGKYEQNMDSIKKGVDKTNWNGAFPINTLDGYLVGNDVSEIYPDLLGNHRFLGTNFNVGLLVDLMTDDVETNDGLLFSLDFDWSPYALNAALDGWADFYSIVFNAVGATTLYQYKPADISWFSLQLVDRFNINWTSGDMVPVYAQKLGSLGRKIRGYANYSYNTELTIVNNLDLRFTSPPLGVEGLYIRLNLFFDMGYGAGRYYNTSITPEKGFNFIASTGAQISFCVFDFIDLGFQVAYLINGRNYAKGDTPLSTGFFFFLDF